MTGYILDINTFNVLFFGNIVKYDAPLGAGKEVPGSITVAEEIEDYSGHWIYIDNHLWLITKSKPEKGLTALTVTSWIDAFERPIIYTSTEQKEYGAYIKGIIESEFVEQTDQHFAMPYITVTNTDQTTFVFPQIPEGSFYGEYSFSDLIKSAISAGVILTPSLMDRGLLISISTKASVIHRIIFGDGRSQLVSQEYSRNIISKITVLRENEDKTGWEETDNYYYHLDGTVSADPPSENLHGLWKTKIVPYDFEYDLIEAAREDMSDNVNSHKIQFYSTVTMQMWDDVLLVMKNGIFISKISCIKVSSENSRYYYECGQLDVCLTDKLTDERKVYLLRGSA